jgi:hypothetical protein
MQLKNGPPEFSWQSWGARKLEWAPCDAIIVPSIGIGHPSDNWPDNEHPATYLIAKLPKKRAKRAAEIGNRRQRRGSKVANRIAVGAKSADFIATSCCRPPAYDLVPKLRNKQGDRQHLFCQVVLDDPAAMLVAAKTRGRTSGGRETSSRKWSLDGWPHRSSACHS